MPVTMREVAAKAGVTPTVVSRVLHNKATAIRVSEATAERVRQAAKDLGYRVNVMARNFRERQTMMIGVLHGVGFPRNQFNGRSRYFAALMDGVIDGAFDHGYSVTLCPKLLGSTPEDAMSDGRFDGLVWYSTQRSEENHRLIDGCTVPLVLIHTPAKIFGDRFPSVSCDNHQGIGLAVDHLVGLGHRRIGFAHDRFGELSFRLQAFQSHMARHGLEVGPDDLIDVCDDGSGAVEYLIAGPRHTALVGAHDGVASLLVELAPQFGVRIPDDLSITGFDSTSFCDELNPRLTSVSQPLAIMGRCAAEMLVKRINGDEIHHPQVIFPCDLDVRGSTQSIPVGK
ncbi:MAG: LacI family DNA-binding transcriptional regulator [Fimbriimonas sp.]